MRSIVWNLGRKSSVPLRFTQDDTAVAAGSTGGHGSLFMPLRCFASNPDGMMRWKIALSVASRRQLSHGASLYELFTDGIMWLQF